MKNFLHNQEFQLDEVLFEHRNQNYGAYVLRHEADKILTKSMFVGVFLFTVLAATPFIVNSFKTVEVVPTKIGGEHHILNVDTPKNVPPVVHVQPIANQVATTKYDIPTPTNHPVKETPATSVKDFLNTNIGAETISGTPPTISVSPPVNVILPITTNPVLSKPIDNSPQRHVDIEAQFSKGIEGFRNGMIQNFDATDFEGVDTVLKTTITFIVEKDGTISDVKANGGSKEFNQEAIKTLKSIRGKWTPAKLNGAEVRSYFNFPISMKFE
ncbi:MAG: energy transducer TonB [Chryseobacterium sp.]|nr:energy transducer TonB [Chryseobacterium sp.]